jgi:hypothetical protein
MERITHVAVQDFFELLMEAIGGEYNERHLYSFKEVDGKKVGYCLDRDRNTGWRINCAMPNLVTYQMDEVGLLADGMAHGRMSTKEFFLAMKFAIHLVRADNLRRVRVAALARVHVLSDFKEGTRWRVVKEGAKLWGMKPIAPYTQQGWGRDLVVGDVLTCGGSGWTGGDGVPAIKWCGADGEWLANDCLFAPVKGGMWGGQVPADGYLERA